MNGVAKLCAWGRAVPVDVDRNHRASLLLILDVDRNHRASLLIPLSLGSQ